MGDPVSTTVAVISGVISVAGLAQGIQQQAEAVRQQKLANSIILQTKPTGHNRPIPLCLGYTSVEGVRVISKTVSQLQRLQRTGSDTFGAETGGEGVKDGTQYLCRQDAICIAPISKILDVTIDRKSPNQWGSASRGGVRLMWRNGVPFRNFIRAVEANPTAFTFPPLYLIRILNCITIFINSCSFHILFKLYISSNTITIRTWRSSSY